MKDTRSVPQNEHSPRGEAVSKRGINGPDPAGNTFDKPLHELLSLRTLRVGHRPYLNQPSLDLPMAGRWEAQELQGVERNYRVLREVLSQSQEPRLRQLDHYLRSTPFHPFQRGLWLSKRNDDSSGSYFSVDDPTTLKNDLHAARRLGVREIPPLPEGEGAYRLSFDGRSWEVLYMVVTGTTQQNLSILADRALFLDRKGNPDDLLVQIAWTHELEHVRLLKQSVPEIGERLPIEAQLLLLEELQRRGGDMNTMMCIAAHRNKAAAVLQSL